MMILQICDTPDKIEAMLELLSGISLVEVARTGTLALEKCRV
jgi:acetolactate synthase-1/3 small subunit